MAADELGLIFEYTDIGMGKVELIHEQSSEAIGSPPARRRAADAPRASLSSHMPWHEIDIVPDASCPTGEDALHSIGRTGSSGSTLCSCNIACW